MRAETRVATSKLTLSDEDMRCDANFCGERTTSEQSLRFT